MFQIAVTPSPLDLQNMVYITFNEIFYICSALYNILISPMKEHIIEMSAFKHLNSIFLRHGQPSLGNELNFLLLKYSKISVRILRQKGLLN